MTLSAEDCAAEYQRVTRSMFHLELRPFYASGGEHFRSWLAGDETPLRDRWPVFADWLEMLDRHAARGVQVGRARVVDEPPTDYQRWESWCAGDNVAGGEQVWEVSRSEALRLGIDPGPGGLDWWFFDDSRLMFQQYDAAGEMARAWISTDPAELAIARRQWSLAIEHGRIDLPAPSQR